MTMTIKRILVPTDFSTTSDAALEWAKSIAGTLGASLHLVHVFEDPALTGPFAAEAYVAMPAETRTALFEDAADRLEHRLSADDRVRFHATSEIVCGVPAPSILDYSHDQHIDLIVMGTHGRTGMAHLLIGSVAERVVRTAECPVLTVHQDRQVVTQPARSYLPEFPEQVPA